MPTFKNQYRDLQEIVRELTKIRAHNRQFREGDSQENLFLFAEASLCLLALERFLRILPDLRATQRDTLRNLLERATSPRVGLLHFVDLGSSKPLTAPHERERCIKEITGVRNSLQHGNYEQAAQTSGCADVPLYFKSQFASEIETLYQITGRLFAQIDPDTGRRRP